MSALGNPPFPPLSKPGPEPAEGGGARGAGGFGDVLRHELRLLAAERTLWGVSLIFAALITYGLYSGVSQITNLDHTLAAALEEQQKRLDGLVKQYRAIVAGTEQPDLYSSPMDPSRVGGGLGARYAVMPSAPLAPLALGQTDFLPNYFKVSSYDKTTFMYQETLENPWHLLDDHFDLAFVIIYLFPLLIFALSYDLLSGEREQGTLRMLLSQPLSLSTLVLGKTAARALVLLALVLAIPIAGLLLARTHAGIAGELTALLLWASVVTAYGLVWFALVLAVNACGKPSATNAIILLSVWIGLVFILPVVMNVLVAKLHPMPSRVDMITHVREVTTATRLRFGALDTETYHPELAPVDKGKVFIQGHMKGWWLTQKELTERIRPILDAFDTQLAKQQDLVDRYRFLSPAVVAHEAMSDLAGTGLKRYRHFLTQVDAFHQQRQAFFFPKVFAETRLTEADYDLMPRFDWREEDRAAVGKRALVSLFGLFVPVAALALLGMRRLKGYPQV